MDRDRLGRRRQPGQERGLRPLHPELPDAWSSRTLRLAMSDEDWARLEALVERLAPDAPSQARAFGYVISTLLGYGAEVTPEPRPLDWLDWERRKTLRLLYAARSSKPS